MQTRILVPYFLSAALLIGWGDAPAEAQRRVGQSGGNVSSSGMNRGGGSGNAEVMAFREEMQKKSQEYQAQEAAEGEAFMQSLAGRPKADLLSALRVFKTEQFQKNTVFRTELSASWLAFIEKRLSSNPQGNPARLQQMKARMASNEEEMKTFFAGKHAENMAFLDKVAADPTLEGQALTTALKTFFQGQKESAKTFMDQRRQGGMQSR